MNEKLFIILKGRMNVQLGKCGKWFSRLFEEFGNLSFEFCTTQTEGYDFTLFVDQESSRDAGDAVELSGFVLPTFEVGELGPLETHASDGSSPGFLAFVEAHTYDFQPLAVEVCIEFLHVGHFSAARSAP